MAKNEDSMELDISDELIAERRAGEPGETPEDMHPLSRWIVGNIDVLNNWVGKLTCLLLIPVIGAMVYEVVARKLWGDVYAGRWLRFDERRSYPR
jgi:hypothetical protein